MPSTPQTYTISDFIEWDKKGQLLLSPDFQRGSVWTPSAKVFLIDTILSGLPVPQVYLRTKIDAEAQTTVREVVDGQQRLRAILEFAEGKLLLTTKAPAFKGLRYGDLPADAKEALLSYTLPVVQLISASDADVLEVFARLNSYSVKVTPAELRHAEYSEPVKWAIYEAARDWAILWNKYGVVSVRDSVRLKNTSVVAEMFMTVDEGFGDGGEANIGKYYKKHKSKEEEYFHKLRKQLNIIVNEVLDNTSEQLKDTTFYDAPNFLVLVAAVGYLGGVVPESRATEGLAAFKGKGVDWERAQENLANIANAFDEEPTEGNSKSPYAAFVSATKSTTHRVASRKARMNTLVKALAPDGVE